MVDQVVFTLGTGSVSQPEQWDRIQCDPQELSERLREHDGLNNGWWCAGVFVTGSRRGREGWYGQGGLATIDVDYHGGLNAKGQPCKAPLPDDVGRMVMDAVAHDTLPWCLYAHTTPNGVRLVALLSRPIKSSDDYTTTALAIMADAARVLAGINPMLHVDDCSKTASQAAYLPGARVGGHLRSTDCAEAVCLDPVAFDVDGALRAAVAPATPKPGGIKIGGPGPASHHDARTGWLGANPLEPGTRMKCPLCGHQECFQVDDANRWHCYSTGHGTDAPPGVGRVHHDGHGVGDALDLAMHERGLSMVEVLTQDGFIRKQAAAPAPVDSIPTVLLPGEWHDGMQKITQRPSGFLDEVFTALNDDTVYRRGSALVRLDVDGKALQPLNPNTLAMIASEQIHTYAFVNQKNKPTKTVYRVLSGTLSSFLLDNGHTHPSVMPIDMVATHPILIRREDRTFRLVESSGYDPEARVYTVPHGLDIHTDMTADACRARLDDLLVDYPFTGESDRQNAIALMVTMVCRTAMSTAPLFHVGASLPGTGKSKLITDTLGATVYGQSPAATAFKGAEEELRKYLESELLKGSACAMLDNVPTGVRVDSASLAAMLTAPVMDMRILGKTQTMQVDNRMVMITTGNNSRWSSELARRTCPITLTPADATPEARTVFAHPHALEFALSNRAAMLSAILSGVRLWMASGCPEPVKMPVVGSYEEWRNVVGGIMECLGYDQVMQNQDTHKGEHGDGAKDDAASLVAYFMADHDVGAGNGKSTEVLLKIADEQGLFQDTMDQAPGDDRRRISFFGRRVMRGLARQPTTAGWQFSTVDGGRTWFLESCGTEVDIHAESA